MATNGKPVVNSFLAGLTPWNVILALIMVGTVFVNSAIVQTRLEDGLKAANDKSQWIEERVQILEQKVLPLQKEIVKLTTEIAHVREDLKEVKDQLNSLMKLLKPRGM